MNKLNILLTEIAIPAAVHLQPAGLLGWVRGLASDVTATLIIVAAAVVAIIFFGTWVVSKKLATAVVGAIGGAFVLAMIGGGLEWAQGLMNETLTN